MGRVLQPSLGIRVARTGHGATVLADLDLAIDAGRPLTLAEQGRLLTAFEEAALPWRVDVVDWATLNDTFRQRIDGERVTVAVLTAGS